MRALEGVRQSVWCVRVSMLDVWRVLIGADKQDTQCVCNCTYLYLLPSIYRVVKMHRIPYLYRS